MYSNVFNDGMRELNEYSLGGLLQLTWLKDFIKEKRNDYMLGNFIKKLAPNEQRFLDQNKCLAGRNIVAVIAFEQPLVLDWLLELCKIRLTEFQILVFDNSLKIEMRREIERVCIKHGTPYLALPANTTRHVNRSHGLAMTWTYHRIIRNLKPKSFGFLDHDMLPIGQIKISDKLEQQPVYGLPNRGINTYWNLWAGFCFFDYSVVSQMSLNFLYDFTRGLDTGGRNWDCLYKTLDPTQIKFAATEDREIKIHGGRGVRSAQFVDDQWIHIGGISYNNNFDGKRAFFIEYVSEMMRDLPNKS